MMPQHWKPKYDQKRGIGKWNQLFYFSLKRLTFSTDASEVCDLHQHAGEHVGFVGAAPPGVDLKSFK